MNKKYENYINHIVNDIESPYFKNMRDMYGLSPDEYELVLSKVFNQHISIVDTIYTLGNMVYNKDGNEIYFESGNGYWEKYGYDTNGDRIYYENSNGKILNR
jgi:urate oxidase